MKEYTSMQKPSPQKKGLPQQEGTPTIQNHV